MSEIAAKIRRALLQRGDNFPIIKGVNAMSRNPRRFTRPVRLIVTVEAGTVARIDALLNAGHEHQHRNRSEFVRRAIERELARYQD